jgi:hypothetical protein
MLSDMQKAQTRLYLGYPDFFRYRHTRLESVLDNLSPDAEVQIAEVLAKIVTVESALLDAGTAGAGIKRVDEIWFENGTVRTSVVRRSGRIYVARLSIITGVPVYSDVFGTQGYLGDSFSGLG